MKERLEHLERLDRAAAKLAEAMEAGNNSAGVLFLKVCLYELAQFEAKEPPEPNAPTEHFHPKDAVATARRMARYILDTEWGDEYDLKDFCSSQDTTAWLAYYLVRASGFVLWGQEGVAP